MATTEHMTRRGALLAELEHRRVSAGHWVVEGWTVMRMGPRWWSGAAPGRPNVAGRNLTSVLEAIALRAAK